jgi:hypothetical protein
VTPSQQSGVESNQLNCVEQGGYTACTRTLRDGLQEDALATALALVNAMTNAQIYCHVCDAIQPLVVDEPQPARRGPYEDATDLVCGACQFIVATTYTPRMA